MSDTLFPQVNRINKNIFKSIAPDKIFKIFRKQQVSNKKIWSGSERISLELSLQKIGESNFTQTSIKLMSNWARKTSFRE